MPLAAFDDQACVAERQVHRHFLFQLWEKRVSFWVVVKRMTA